MSRKLPQFQEIRKLQNLLHENKQVISCIENPVILNFEPFQNAAKEGESGGRSYVHLNWVYVIVLSVEKISCKYLSSVYSVGRCFAIQ